MSRRRAVNILFTSAGRRVELLCEFRDAYREVGLDGRIVVTDIDALAPAFQVADRTYIVPSVGSPEYVPALVEICRREKVMLVFPLIDPDIPVLANNREVLEATGAKVMVVSAEAAEITRDKWLTWKFFLELGIPAPKTWLPAEGLPDTLRYPVFLKPRFGSAAKHARKVEDAEELAFFLRRTPDPIVQEVLPGPEITTDVISDVNGRVIGAVSRQRIEIRAGEVAKGQTVYYPEVLEYSVKIASALKAIGPITVQCMFRNGSPFFTEVNARFGGGSPLGIRAGVKSPHWLLGMAAGLKVEIPPLGTYEKGLYFTRYDQSFVLREGDYEKLARCRV